MSANNPHITGRYVIIAALVGVIGSLGGIMLNHQLSNESDPDSNEASENLQGLGLYKIETGIGIALRKTRISSAEMKELNKCHREGYLSERCKKINQRTKPIDLPEGQEVILYETSGQLHYIETVDTHEKGYIAKQFAGKPTLVSLE